MVLETSLYTITNVRQNNLAYLADPHDDSPVAANYPQNDKSERWNVNDLGNGRHSIQSQGQNMFAATDNRAPVGASVIGSSRRFPWLITETRVKGQYTISTTDTRFFWGLVDNQLETPIVLASSATDSRNAWIFKKVNEVQDAPAAS
ncbi:hypothetical protein GALMADRAFT_147606 [Galerina marginata CBS 339.88]|uniref:Ricin B lectin domain-containing protein n=1 Tax=Galerina marginata (strain CBS 339.88) TaxID=685588 RepID=A0A067S9U3_GALM3|nr:hypothetical protein GALMADRAFT_147606 [Galerina marginata CBS 339.88]